MSRSFPLRYVGLFFSVCLIAMLESRLGHAASKWDRIDEEVPKANGDIKKLYELLFGKLGYNASRPIFIPASRSRQRNGMNYKDPRMVQSFGQDLLIGYSPINEELEIITRDRDERDPEKRTRFYIVDDFRPGGSHLAKEQPPENCGGCHQGGSAIFWRAPWRGTNSDPVAMCMIRFYQADPSLQKDILVGKKSVADLKGLTYKGFDLDIVGGGFEFQAVAKATALEIRDYEICHDACGSLSKTSPLERQKTLDCRRLMLTQHLLTNSNPLNSSGKRVLGKDNLGLANCDAAEHFFRVIQTDGKVTEKFPGLQPPLDLPRLKLATAAKGPARSLLTHYRDLLAQHWPKKGWHAPNPMVAGIDPHHKLNGATARELEDPALAPTFEKAVGLCEAVYAKDGSSVRPGSGASDDRSRPIYPATERRRDNMSVFGALLLDPPRSILPPADLDKRLKISEQATVALRTDLNENWLPFGFVKVNNLDFCFNTQKEEHEKNRRLSTGEVFELINSVSDQDLEEWPLSRAKLNELLDKKSR